MSSIVDLTPEERAAHTGDCADGREQSKHREQPAGHPVHDANRHAPYQELARADSDHGDRPEAWADGASSRREQLRWQAFLMP